MIRISLLHCHGIIAVTPDQVPGSAVKELYRSLLPSMITELLLLLGKSAMLLESWREWWLKMRLNGICPSSSTQD